MDQDIPAISSDVAELLAESSALYLDVINDISVFFSEPEGEEDKQVIKVIRRIGLEAAGRIALANRLIDQGRIEGTLKVDPAYDPRVVQPLLRILGDCFTLMAVAATRAQLKEQPLIEGRILKRALWREQIYDWVMRCGGEDSAGLLGLDSADLAASQMPRVQ